MTVKPIPRPRASISLAKLIGDIVTGQVEDGVDDGKAAGAADMRRKGGAACAAARTPKQRAEVARAAAQARWKLS